MAGRPARYYVNLGIRALLEVLEAQGATVWPEVEARIADTRWPTVPYSIDPHHLTTARQELLASEAIRETTTLTRGGPGRAGRLVTVQHLPLVWGRRRAVWLAAQRKRLLYGRFQGWAQPTVRHTRGLVGPAGEAVVHASLRAAALEGRYSLVRPAGGEVSHLLGGEIPGGPVDDAAVLLAVEQGIPSVPIHLLIEVKNVRHWIYPSSHELYQLLRKAAAVQGANPGALVLPVLVCRRRHFTTFAMGMDLGFYIIEAKQQFVLPRAGIHAMAFKSVREGLAYMDLALSDGPDGNLTNIFRDTLPRDALQLARRWQARATTPEFHSLLHLMGKSGRVSAVSLGALRRYAATFPDSLGRW